MDFDQFGEDFSVEFDNEMEFEEVTSEQQVAGTPLEVLPGFDVSAGNTWIYPSNMSHRKYQFDIVQSSLYSNTLVCLPTGLGKTFIAAVIMYNFYRWYPRGKIVFMAPTKPLVGQQIDACFKVMGIPQSDTVEMTGEVGQKERKSAWKERRVFFLTPQVLNSDLTRGRCSARDIKLLIVDEAHRALGNYAYCTAVRELVRAGAQTRIVALSATPGSDIPSVKKIIQNLCISHIELRQEDSPDILPYTHKRSIEKIVINIGEDVNQVKQKLLSVIEIYTKKLSAAQAVRRGHMPTTYSKWALLQARDEWRQVPPQGASNSLKGQVEADFATVINLYSGMELLVKQGLRSLYKFWTKTDITPSTKRIRGELTRIPMWREIMSLLTESFSGDTTNTLLNAGPGLSQAGAGGVLDLNQKVSTSHPKMDKLLEVVKEHFQNFVRDGRDTKVIIFNEKRDCVNELVACLSRLKPLVRPKHFIGQASSANNKGLNQKDQIEIVRRFKEGVYNTIVATCVGEEGLDIGEVDLIVLYDMKTSPISYVQRIGRTGRKRDGRVVVLVSEGAEERDYKSCLFQVKQINKELQDKSRLENVLYTNSPRMIPRGLTPVCHQMKMIVRDWEGREGQAESRGMFSASLNRRTKDDVFRNNRGALTEADQERWNNLEKFKGKVKRVREARELWTEESRNPFDDEDRESCYDLSDFRLWQSGKQNRRLVSVGSLTRTYNRIMNLIRHPESLRKTDKENRREKRPSGEANRITNYYLHSQDKTPARPPVNRAAGNDRDRQLAPVLEIEDDDDDEFITEIPISKVDVEEAHDMLIADENQEIIENVEEEEESVEELLLRELLPEEDSGIFSPCSSPSSPPSIERLINNPPTRIEIQNFDLSVAIEKALAKVGIREGSPIFEADDDIVKSPEKHRAKTEERTEPIAESNFDPGVPLPDRKTEFIVPPPQTLQVYPVDRNTSVEDMFADDSFSEFFESSVATQDGAKSAQAKQEEKQSFPASNFDLGSPFIEEEEDDDLEKFETPSNPQNTDPEEQLAKPLTESNFDLGSPIVEGDDDIVKSRSKPFAGANFDLGSPVFEDDDDTIKSPEKPRAETERRTEPIAESNFDLGSPVFEDDDDTIKSPEKPRAETETRTEPIAEANFDLGSPILEDDDDIVKSNFNYGSPVPAVFEVKDDFKIPELTSNTSTPIVPWPQKSRTNTEPKPPDNNQMNESEDMFGDDSEDDQLFLDVDEVDYNKKEDTGEILYNTSALLEIMNETKNKTESFTSETPAKKRRKLTFEDLSENIAGPSVIKNEDTVDIDPSSTSGEERKSDGSSNRSANLLGNNQEETNVCPVCSTKVPGDLTKFNEHLDICLNVGVIQELTQNGNTEPSHLQESQSPDTSPIFRNKVRRRVIASQSVQSIHQERETSSSSDESQQAVRKSKKSKNNARQFIDSEAELSGDQKSDDEAEDTEDHYDESFVDDASQAVDHGVYLRSVKSPEFRKPFSRPLPPITEDIFSQAVHESEDDSYEEDSFCVGDSMVELDSCHDTLDLLEQKAEEADRPGRQRGKIIDRKKKRKRILLNSSSEESMDNVSLVAPNREKKRKRIVMAPSDDETVYEERQEVEPPVIVQSPVLSQTRIQSKPTGSNSLSESSDQQKTVIFSSAEVGKSQDVISSLRYLHGFNVLVEKSDPVSVVCGSQTAVLRIPEHEFNLGTAKEKLMQRIQEAQDYYCDVLVIVELDKQKRGGGQHRTKQQDLTVSQLGLAGIKVCYSPSQLETAEMIAQVAAKAEDRGQGLPRGKRTDRQQRVVSWLRDVAVFFIFGALLRDLPGTGLGAAHTLATSFQTLSALISSSTERLVQRGADQRTAERLVSFFNETFQPGLTEMAPL